jgi:CRP-like cAMP-binding protein
MDLNLILSAQSLRLAPQLLRSGEINGLLVIKNIPAKTYLRVTPEEWVILQQFETSRTVPSVLGTAIRERFCLPLGEFYELILKALRANILLEPGVGPEVARGHEWSWSVRPKFLKRPLYILFFAGLIMALVFHPRLPTMPLDWAAGLLLLCAALSFGNFLAACLIRGAGGEVYPPHWTWVAVPPHLEVDCTDSIMLPREDQVTVGVAIPAALAAAAGIAAWHRPEWTFLPVLGLGVSLRPILSGAFAGLIHVGSRRSPSDAEHDYIFPHNRRPEARVQLLKRALSEPTTWARMGYGVLWTLIILYWCVRLSDTPPWTLGFWETNGIAIAFGIGGSLILLAAGYLGWELLYIARETTRSRRAAFKLWKTRWFGGESLILDESSRAKTLAASPLFSALQPPQRQEIARAMAVRKHGPWTALSSKGRVPDQVSMIVSGKVSLRRELPSGRMVQVQVLSEGDIIGLHDLADPKFPTYYQRTLTPVTLLTMERATAERLVVQRLPQTTLSDTLLKLPFLRRIALCRNWHLQAINRFARLSSITSFPTGEIILSEGQTVEDFFIIFQGDARVVRNERQLAIIHSGEFFGEIGLMQNSSPNASVIANNGTRCLSIARTELLRFVTHNYTVALEIERVSSERLGRPLFPLKSGDFRSI